MIAFDHLKLARRNLSELKRFREWLMSAAPGEFDEVAVIHERDRRCCRKEPWDATAKAIVEAVRPPTPQILLNVYGAEQAPV
jgi:hypothetical protein